jgi:predicted signal transduction protein with EAL and GGDEF domain
MAPVQTTRPAQCRPRHFKGFSERHQFEDRMKTWAMQDELTGLLNRRDFSSLPNSSSPLPDASAESSFSCSWTWTISRRSTTPSVMNWEMRAIQEMAQVMNETFRKADILARIGGDEFCRVASRQPPDMRRRSSRAFSRPSDP